MGEEPKPDEEYGMRGLTPKRPGGPAQSRPVQYPDGSWRDSITEETVEAPADYKEKSADDIYAERFWSRQPEGMRSAVADNIERAAQMGTLSIITDNKGITEYDKERLSAYRKLADDMGYEVGQFKFDSRNNGVSTTIIKK